MAALQNEFVVRNPWLEPAQYGLAFSLARLTPGTNVIAFCVGTAWLMNGWVGAAVAALAVTVPCAALVVWLSWAYQMVKSNPLAMAAISGTLAAAVGMMFAAAWTLVRPQLTRRGWLRAAALAAGSAATALFGLSPILVLGLAAVAGYLWTVDEP